MGLVQTLVNGIVLGGLYSCLAVGFSLVWGVLNVVNMLHGSLIILGGYLLTRYFKRSHEASYEQHPAPPPTIFTVNTNGPSPTTAPTSAIISIAWHGHCSKQTAQPVQNS